MELTDASPPANISSTVDDNQIPPLLSMIIECLPVLQQSKYTEEAETLMKQYTDRWQNIVSFDSYCRVGLSATSSMYPGVIDADRLVAIALQHSWVFVVDDLLIDSPGDEFLLGQYGIDPSVCDSPRQLLEYLDHLGAVFGQKLAPRNSAIEVIMWEVGHKLCKMSDPERFSAFVGSIIAWLHSIAKDSAEISAGENSSVEDLELYTS